MQEKAVGGLSKVRLVLVGTEGEINIGFIARLAVNFGVDELYFVSPKANPFSEESKRFAARAAYVLEPSQVKIVTSLDEAIEDVDIAVCTSSILGSKSDVLRHAVTPRQLAEEILPRYRSAALVFGRESVGLTRDELSKCHLMSFIPANPEYPVLNLSHAVAVFLYELWQSRVKGFQRLHDHARREELERLYRLFERLNELTVDPERRQQVKAAVAHLLWKSELTRGEASMIYLLLKKVVRAVEKCTSG
jgi:TrmH family RNA methyltransferase